MTVIYNVTENGKLNFILNAKLSICIIFYEFLKKSTVYFPVFFNRRY